MLDGVGDQTALGTAHRDRRGRGQLPAGRWESVQRCREWPLPPCVGEDRVRGAGLARPLFWSPRGSEQHLTDPDDRGVRDDRARVRHDLRQLYHLALADDLVARRRQLGMGTRIGHVDDPLPGRRGFLPCPRGAAQTVGRLPQSASNGPIRSLLCYAQQHPTGQQTAHCRPAGQLLQV